MLVTAASFPEVIVAVHIILVVLAFGFVVTYPLIALMAGSSGGSGLHRARLQISRMIVNPGLVLVLITGIYLASDLHQWKQFYVQWAIAMIVILGGLEGAIIARQEGKLANLVEAGGAASSPDQAKALRLTQITSWVMAAIVVVTIYLMAVQA